MKNPTAGLPKVSVVIPTYNRAHLIKGSISSVLGQSMDDFEIVVVDDQSNDDTKQVVDSLGEERIRYVENTGAKGVSAARNIGIANSRGKWVAFLDSDDEWTPQKLQLQIEFLERNQGYDGVGCGWRWIDSVTKLTRAERVPGANGRIQGLPRWFYNICQDLVILRESLQREPFDEALSTYECMDWVIRLWRTGRYGVLPYVLVNCYEHAGPRASEGKLRCIRALEQVVGRYPEFIRSDRGAWAALNQKIGAGFLVAGNDDKKARRYLIRSLKSDPRRARAWAYLMATLMPNSVAKTMRGHLASRRIS